MTHIVENIYVDEECFVRVSTTDGTSVVRLSASGSFSIRHAGKLLVTAVANYLVLTGFSGEPETPQSTQTKTLPLTVEIKTPDGQPFTADHVTLTDVWRFRDLRGTSGTWTFSIHGEKTIHLVGPHTRVLAKDGRIRIMVEETVQSQSAPPLVSDTLAVQAGQRYGFDLFRVGTFVATAKSSPLLPFGGQRRMNLIDPDGVTVASSNDGRLTFPVTLATLGKSRNAEGKPRAWSLEVLPGQSITTGGRSNVSATVIASARIGAQVLKDRINFLLGPRGAFLSIYGETKDPSSENHMKAQLLLRLLIKDKYSAETIDMHKLLRDVLKGVPQDAGVSSTDILPHVPYTLAHHARDVGPGGDLHVSLDEGTKITTIDIGIGASSKIQPPIPALKLTLGVEGHAKVKLGGFEVGTVEVRGGSITLEAGARLEADGTFSPVIWVPANLIKVSVTLEPPSPGEITPSEALEIWLNGKVLRAIEAVLQSAVSQLPHLLEFFLGDTFTFRSLHLEGEDIVFDYIAPLEPEPKPYQDYVPIMGRSATQLGPNFWQITPRSMGDTWSAPNLNKRIEHIVVVMMENRSFDHVLGYRALLPNGQGSDGLSNELIEFLKALARDENEPQGYPVPKLNESPDIADNLLHRKTKFPAPVGHGLADVTEQLSETVTMMPSGRSINSPKGFISNFAKRAEKAGIKVENVLGYYEADDLPFFKFLAENYSYSEKFFCSHAGPTLPNRMLSITGDVQYDRTGEAILDNNSGDNFVLSRAQTIFDVLERKGVSWRVYESPPSVTMLRMFARYASDNTHIVPISQLAQDVLLEAEFPAVTIVDPAMHHSPQNDDHPIADMYNGQIFLKEVYDTLRSNDALWRKTLLIITYDEHGGFYDHVIPPIAEARTRPLQVSGGTPPGPGPFTPSTLLTHYGVRVPTFVVSPWTPAGKGPDIVLDHCSILKTILARFCGQDRPFVSDRVNASRSFESFLSEPEPRLAVPSSPEMERLPIDDGPSPAHSQIDTEPVSRKKMRAGDVDSHELMGMVARMLGR